MRNYGILATTSKHLFSKLLNSTQFYCFREWFHESPRITVHLRISALSWQYTQVYAIAGEGNGNSLQYSCLENPMDGGAWWAAVHGVAKSQTRLTDFTFTFHFHSLEREMATHSSVLVWRFPRMEGPGGLPSRG